MSMAIPHSADQTDARTNKHHNIPRSRGGSEAECNLSVVNQSRHDAFHRDWGANRTPCLLSRLIGLHSIGLGDDALSANQIENLIQITSLQNWSRLYRPDAFDNVATISAIENAIKVSEYTQTHLLEEQVWIRQTIAAIVNGGTFPSQHSLFIHNCLKFFNVRTPREAIIALLTERHNTDLSWSKPLLKCTRTSIVNLLKEKELPVPRRQTVLVPILDKQQKTVLKYLRDWEKARRSSHTHRRRFLRDD